MFESVARRFIVRLVAVVIATALAISVAADNVVLEPTATGLRASGVTKGGDAILFGATIGSFAKTRLLKRHALVVADSDRDGRVDFDLQPLPRFAFLVAVDAATGHYAIHKGEGVEGSELDTPGQSWRVGLEQFDVAAMFLEVLLVRPGTGAWTARLSEGGHKDGDQTLNGRVRIRVKDMDVLTANGGGPATVRPGDLLVVVDAQTLAYLIGAAKE